MRLSAELHLNLAAFESLDPISLESLSLLDNMSSLDFRRDFLRSFVTSDRSEYSRWDVKRPIRGMRLDSVTDTPED